MGGPRPGKIGPGPINLPEPGDKIWVWVRDFRIHKKTSRPEPNPFKTGLGRVDPWVMWVDPFCRFFISVFSFISQRLHLTPTTVLALLQSCRLAVSQSQI